jgi:hypothetical protein
MEVVIDYETIEGERGEDFVKELSVAAENVHNTFHFLPPYLMPNHTDDSNGLSWTDGYIDYSNLAQTLKEAVAPYAHPYAKGATKARFLSNLLERSVLNLDVFNCPERDCFQMGTACIMPCHRFPDKKCASRNARALFDWLKVHLKEKSYVKCPKDSSRHTAAFNSGVRKP